MALRQAEGLQDIIFSNRDSCKDQNYEASYSQQHTKSES
jgi:hypothetical protein